MSNINRGCSVEQLATSLSRSSSSESLDTSAAIEGLIELGNATVTSIAADSESYSEPIDLEADDIAGNENESARDQDERGAFPDDGKYDYFAARCDDTLAGWTYTKHPKSICLTPPSSWSNPPSVINVDWYKRPLRYCSVHTGYFLSNSSCFVQKVEELGAEFDPDRV